MSETSPTVWAVMEAFQYEGEMLLAIYATEQGAQSYIDNLDDPGRLLYVEEHKIR